MSRGAKIATRGYRLKRANSSGFHRVQAIDEVQPYGVDVCSGVRTNGDLDENKLKAFIEGAWRLSVAWHLQY